MLIRIWKNKYSLFQKISYFTVLLWFFKLFLFLQKKNEENNHISDNK